MRAFLHPVDFWLEEFGMDTVKAFITIRNQGI